MSGPSPVSKDDYVRVRAFGTRYVGRVVDLSSTQARVRVTLANGNERTVERPFTELERIAPTRFERTFLQIVREHDPSRTWRIKRPPKDDERKEDR